MGNLLIAHGGGPTPVINSSLRGVVEQAKKQPQIGGIYGARFGVEGVLNEAFIDLGAQSEAAIRGLSSTPASALGSCRRKLKSDDYPRILDVFKKYDIRYFLYNGGNDSMDTCNKIAALAKDSGYEMRVIGVPKTIDNDLMHTDHCPGFGSAARYVAVSTLELWKDVQSLPIHVCIMEVMGRNAGFITAVSALARKSEGCGPHLIYLPERPFIREQFLEDVSAWHKRAGGVLVVVSEGLCGPDGAPLSDSGVVDGFGHKVPGGVSQHLSELVIRELGIKSRSEKPGLLGRCSIPLQSPVDRDEAYQVGALAVRAACEYKTGFMVSITRECEDPYRAGYGLVPLSEVANAERKFPDNWINARGNDINPDFIKYCAPLMGAALPDYIDLDLTPVKKL